MANTITRQVLNNGPRDYVVKFTIIGDGSGEETAARVNSVTGDMGTDVALMEVEAAFSGFSGLLYWDATSDIPLAQIAADMETLKCFRSIGGIVNNAGTGKNGDVILATTGLGTGDSGTIVMRCKKKG